MTAAGRAAIGCGPLVLAATHADRPLGLAAFSLALTGVGIRMNTGALMSVTVDTVTAARSGTASALTNVARMAGATLGAAFLGAAFAMWGGGVSGLRVAILASGRARWLVAAAAFVTIGIRYQMRNRASLSVASR